MNHLSLQEHNARERPLSRLDRCRVTLRPLLLPTFCLAQLLDALNLSGANVALPTIKSDLNFTSQNLQWVISAYALTFGGFLLLTGRLGDIYGHRTFFIAGLVWFTIFAILSGFAQSTTWLIVARGLQGIGAASTIPNAIALILQVYPIGRQRNQAMSLFASTGAIGFVAGLIIGGGVTSSSLGWRWIFFISAILSALMAIISVFVIPARSTDENDLTPDESDRPISTAPVEKATVDYMGATLSTVAMLLFVYVLTDGNSRGWSDPLIISLLVVSILMLVAFVFVERKVKQPLMPPSVWKLPNFTPAFIIAACLVGYFQGFLFYVTLIFEVFHYTALESAVHYLPLGIVASIMGVMSEKIIHRFNIKVALVLGLALGTIGNIILGFYNYEYQYWYILFPSFIIGCTGSSSVYASVSIAAIGAAPSDQAGIVGGLLNTAFQIGGGLGLAITTAIAAPFATPQTKGQDLLVSYHAGLWAGSGLLALALIIAIVFVRAIPSKENTRDPSETNPTHHNESAEVMIIDGAGAVHEVDCVVEGSG